VSAVRQFRRQQSTHARGRAAEAVGVSWLERQGLRVKARNFRTKAGEIDVVGADADTLVFIEIKARSTPDFGPASGAVPPLKQRRIARAAAIYIARNPYSGPCRFDVLAMDSAGDTGWSYTWIRNAFDAL